MPQIMQPQALQVRGAANRCPRAFEVGHRPIARPRREQVRRRFWRLPVGVAIISSLPHLRQQLADRGRQRDPVLSLLLGVRARLSPGADLEVELIPSGAEHFAAPGTSQQQQPDRVGGRLTRVRCQRIREAAEFVAAQVSITPFFIVALDASGLDCRIAYPNGSTG